MRYGLGFKNEVRFGSLLLAQGLLGIDITEWRGISEKNKKKSSVVRWEDSDSEMRFDAGLVVVGVQGFRRWWFRGFKVFFSQFRFFGEEGFLMREFGDTALLEKQRIW
ncbi:hypothetical protein U1Q18_000647 [Sarracenia purpurea var. burkii]